MIGNRMSAKYNVTAFFSYVDEEHIEQMETDETVMSIDAANYTMISAGL